MLSEVGVVGIPEERLQLLAESVGIDREELSTLTCRPIATQKADILLFMDAYVPVTLFRKERSAICVECLRGRSTTPAIWDLRLICTCVRHRRWLIDVCPKCRRPLNWRREHLLLCQCGNDLTSSSRSSFEPPETVLLFTKALECRLRRELPFDEEAADRFSCFTADRLVADCISAFQRMRSYLVRWCDRDGIELPRSTRSHCIDMATLLSMSQVLIDWPAPLHAVLHPWSSVSGVDNNQSPWVSQNGTKPIIPPLHPLLRQFREVIGEERVRAAYGQFCEQHKITTYGYRQWHGPPPRRPEAFPAWNDG